MKATVNNSRYFLKFYHQLIGGPIRAREVMIYSIVAEFEANNRPCFISRKELAERINESEATAERSVQLLLKLGLLTMRREGRLRYLSTGYPQKPDLYQIDTHQEPDLYQNRGRSVSKSTVDLYQPDTLIRSNNQIKLTRSIIRSNTLDQASEFYDPETRTLHRKKRP